MQVWNGHSQDASHTELRELHSTESRAMLEISEITFCVIFSFELLLKVVSAEGVSAYLKDNFPFNLLDALIVVVSDAVLVSAKLFHK